MEFIPLITMKSRNIAEEQSKLLEAFLTEDETDKTLYILDLYGINKDKPNLCTYQKLSKDYDLWIDSGPRNLGDVVDVFMTGANAITLRKTTWSNIDISTIREISENKIYLNIEKNIFDELIFYNNDGLVNFTSKEDLENDFKYEQMLKQLVSKNNVYFYENDVRNLAYWKAYGVKNLLVDIDKMGDFKRYGF